MATAGSKLLLSTDHSSPICCQQSHFPSSWGWTPCSPGVSLVSPPISMARLPGTRPPPLSSLPCCFSSLLWAVSSSPLPQGLNEDSPFQSPSPDLPCHSELPQTPIHTSAPSTWDQLCGCSMWHWMLLWWSWWLQVSKGQRPPFSSSPSSIWG